jgi:hypothetical protein
MAARFRGVGLRRKRRCDLPVERRQLGLQPSQMPHQRVPDHWLSRAPQAVALAVDLLCQLASAQHQGLQAGLRHAHRRTRRRPGKRAVARDHRGIEAIGLGQPAETLGTGCGAD